MLTRLLHIKNLIKSRNAAFQRKKRMDAYLKSGRIPWSSGYHDFRIEKIKHTLNGIEHWKVGEAYGIGLDERIVEYPWILSKLSNSPTKLLDAGSTLNHDYILEHPLLVQKRITIVTYNPESPSFTEKRINYIYEDLRQLPFLDKGFDEVVCISTLEHIDMDNSMYGYDLPSVSVSQSKSYEYQKVISELYRVLDVNGRLLITVPFGKYEYHGFFQQFDSEMIGRIAEKLNDYGRLSLSFFRYLPNGWVMTDEESCSQEESYNPHTGKGKGNDGAAHSRAICCIEFVKLR